MAVATSSSLCSPYDNALANNSLPSRQHGDDEGLQLTLGTELTCITLTNTQRASALGMKVFVSPEALATEFVSTAKNGDVARLKTLLATPGCYINATDARGWTALHWAAATGNTALVELLCSMGANVKLETESGKTPLDLALLTSNDDVIDALLDHLPVKGEEDDGCGGGSSDMELTLVNSGPLKDHAGGPDRRHKARRHSHERVASTPAPAIPEKGLKRSGPVSGSGGLQSTTPPMFPHGSLETLLEAKGLEEDMMLSLCMGEKEEAVIKKEGGSASNVNDPDRKCSDCGCSKTPQWRRGPNGPGTLCNSCGLKFIHLHNRDKKNARRREVYMLQKMVKEAQQLRQTQQALGLPTTPIVPFVVDAASAHGLMNTLTG